MAGYDAAFRFHPEERPLIVALVAGTRRRARKFDLRFSSHVSAEGYGYCTFDGNGFRLDLLLAQLARDLPTIAEATPVPRHSPNERRRLANGFCDVLTRYRGGLYDRYDRDDELYIPRVRRLSRATVLPVHALWPGRGNEDLYGRLAVTEEILMLWLLGDAKPEVVMEEAHTAAELMLSRLNGKRRAPAFSELISGAADAGLFHDNLRVYYEKDAPGALDTTMQLLESLKDERKRVRHAGADTAGVWLGVHFAATAHVLERLSWLLAGWRPMSPVLSSEPT